MANTEDLEQDVNNMTVSQSEKSTDEFEEGMARFAPVIANIKFDLLPEHALSLRNRRALFEVGADEQVKPSSSSSNCKLIEPPLFGSYHILYKMEFDTGEYWMFKFPVTGHEVAYNESAAQTLRSEALTMKMLSRETSISVPKFHEYNDKPDNELGCPYILMDFVDGMNGQDAWFDRSITAEQLEARRVRILREVATAMSKLGQFFFKSGGAPEFDGDGVVTGSATSMRVADNYASLLRMQSDDDDHSPIYCEIGPFKDAREFLLNPSDRRNPPTDEFSQGIFKLLRKFIEWLPLDERSHSFVLTHPDFDIQNIIVKEDGSLAAIIDWDGVAAVPRCMGNEKLPSWLTRDWDPAMYAYGQELEDGEPCREDSPAGLAKYRAMYARFLREKLAERESSNVVGRSLLVDNLYIAADDPMCTDGIVEKLFEECLRARQWRRGRKPEGELGQEGKVSGIDQEAEDDVYLYELVTELEDGEFSQKQLVTVKEGFTDLCLLLDDLDSPFWYSADKADVKNGS